MEYRYFQYVFKKKFEYESFEVPIIELKEKLQNSIKIPEKHVKQKF